MKKTLLTGTAALSLAVGTAHADVLDQIYAEQLKMTRAIGRCEMDLKKYDMMMNLVPPNVDIGKRNDNSGWFFDSCMKGEGYQYNYKGYYIWKKTKHNCGDLRTKHYNIPETLNVCWEKLP